jgi:predicted lipoprotein with Yx(FWY)xxD motif
VTPVAPQVEVTELKVAPTGLGEVVTDANGRVLYLFTQDTQGAGTSACTGECLAAWPPAFAGDAAPKGTGVTGTIATIDVAGGKQVTLDGWPLYYFAQDVAAGDVKGQGVNEVWYALDPAGQPVRTMPSSRDGGMGY